MTSLIEITNFWMEHRNDWFKVSDKFDNICSNKYKDYFDNYKDLSYDKKNPREVLGLIILLDQLSRNIFRGKPKAYKYDNEVCNIMLKNFHLSTELEGWEKIFFLMPLKHSENYYNQKYNIQLWKSIIDHTFELKLERLYINNLKTCQEHYKIIKNFGRFPKRNKYLKRENTEKEEKYLVENPKGFI